LYNYILGVTKHFLKCTATDDVLRKREMPTNEIISFLDDDM